MRPIIVFNTAKHFITMILSYAHTHYRLRLRKVMLSM